MFIFIFICLLKLSVPSVIYIPLCLYLYFKNSHFSIALKNLHSTMFIFISPSFICILHPPVRFTFHYVYIYMSSIPRLAFARITFTFHYVYIYMMNYQAMFGQMSSFTFHYVYIYILSLNSAFGTACWFTFHYVYIYIDTVNQNWWCLLDLHSTMFIFIFERPFMVLISLYHLHSTLFIFISCSSAVMSFKSPHLHSTMFIFIWLRNLY